VTPPAGPGIVFNGGAGFDTIAASGGGARTWSINGFDSGTVMGPAASFALVENALRASAPDTFVIRPARRPSGAPAGAGGPDPRNLVRVPGVTAGLTGGGADGMNLVLGGSAGGTARNINNLVGSPFGQNTLLGTNGGGNWTIAPGANSYSGGGQIGFSGFNVLRGGAGADPLAVSLNRRHPLPPARPRFRA